ncbi:hypothetical protein MCHLDSM_02969 [Mycolicibacterium chlorophenolicum]|uniref:Uncharacterized protein n=1 Tax=Mycolicibacterium chlorophenolicum TaxID=37916 RepID=A0A0J6W0G3_9MYCO|nr:hypothetical protein MCHLDSM_02969 [Mycolicibacterium chlorophenolicum]
MHDCLRANGIRGVGERIDTTGSVTIPNRNGATR